MTAYARNKTPITAAQIKKLHALKSALTLEDDVYRLSLRDLFGVASSKELSRYEAGELIKALEGKAIEFGVWECRTDKRERFNHLGERSGMASPEQLRKIDAQWQEVSRVGADERPKALRHFVERIAKVSDLRFLDATGAGKVLNALKSMQRKKVARETERKE